MSSAAASWKDKKALPMQKELELKQYYQKVIAVSLNN